MFKCNSCGYESTKFFGLCPKCRNGYGEESFENLPNFANGNNNHSLQNIHLDIKTVDPNAPSLKSCKVTKYPNFNRILSTSGGFVEGQVVLLGASPGVGKSTLCISISDDDTLYISSEENYMQVNSRALRVNPNAGIKILNSVHIDEILYAIETSEEKFIIIDSLNSIDFGVGYLTVAKYANEITNMIKKCNKICIIISQVGKSGEISGMNAIIHMVDTVLFLEKSEVSSNVIAVSTKNRFGEIGEIAVFKHEPEGFKEIDANESSSGPEIGSTLVNTRFGHKNMTVSMDALVAVAQSSFGIRKASGYNSNRLMQLIGILCYYGKFDLSNKDIYVAVSNGLFVDDINVELAIANSILSSFFKKAAIKEAYGEVKLSGKIINGSVDGKPINHINDLIRLYKT